MAAIWFLPLFITAAGLTVWGTGRLLPLLRRRVLDIPNARSSHAAPTPRGGGIVPVAVIGILWVVVAAVFADFGTSLPWILAGLAGLAAISFRDDLAGMPILWRLTAQILAVTVVLVWLPVSVQVFAGWLPLPMDRIATGILWLWFINLFNFMDGIDGISGIETGSISLGIVLLALFGALPLKYGAYAVILLGAAVGFLRWNWSPAVVFLGDVGSVSLGFLLGWLLIIVAAAGHPGSALLLALYYLGDATVTLLRRLTRGEKIWKPHRSHYYQQAAAAWRNHARVGLAILGLNGLLIVLALSIPLMGLHPLGPVLAGGIAVAGLLTLFARTTVAS